MAIATERNLSELQDEFGFQIDRHVACFHNAFRVCMLVLETTHELPHIWRVVFEGEDAHAYVVLRGLVYNSGVTWSDNTYPDFDMKELENRGEDVTVNVLEAAIKAYNGEPDDMHFGAIGQQLMQELRNFCKAQISSVQEGIAIDRDDYYSALLGVAYLKATGFSPSDFPDLFGE